MLSPNFSMQTGNPQNETKKFAVCINGHFHWITAPLIGNQLDYSVDYETRLPNYVTNFSKILYCPCDKVDHSVQSKALVEGIGDNASVMKQIEDKMFDSMRKKQDEILDNFKKESTSVIKDFKNLFKELRSEANSISLAMISSRNQIEKLSEQVQELEFKIQDMVPSQTSSGDSDSSSAQSEESEDILEEIDLIKQSDRIYMDYRPLTGQPWEVPNPIVFEVTICDITLNAIYDPRVAKSVMSEDVLFSDDETDELDNDKVFYVPWWFPKLQCCRDESTVEVVIHTYHTHTVNVAVNPSWNKTVVLGFNFGQKFVNHVNQDNKTIEIQDNDRNSVCVNFEWYD